MSRATAPACAVADASRKSQMPFRDTLPVGLNKKSNMLPPLDAKTLYSLKADSLYVRMMQESDNFIAEQLLLLCSWRRTGLMNTTQTIDFAKKNLLNDLPDELWTKINIEFYKDSADAVFKALVE